MNWRIDDGASFFPSSIICKAYLTLAWEVMIVVHGSFWCLTTTVSSLIFLYQLIFIFHTARFYILSLSAWYYWYGFQRSTYLFFWIVFHLHGRQFFYSWNFHLQDEHYLLAIIIIVLWQFLIVAHSSALVHEIIRNKLILHSNPSAQYLN